MTVITLSNADFRASIALKGAELLSFEHKKSGFNCMWDHHLHNEASWPNKAPVLFPIIGNLAQGQYHYQDKAYALSRHGFARNSQFKICEQTPTSITLCLTHNSETLAVYPFEFELKIKFELNKNKLTVRYDVMHTGEQSKSKPMLFSLGSHPAFVHDEQAYIEFESLPQAYLGDGGYIDFTKPTQSGINANRISIADHDFNQGPLYFKNVRGQKLILKNPASENDHQLVMSIPDTPYLGIWKKSGEPFICIEPWHGITDPNSTQITHLENKQGIITLNTGEQFSTYYQLQMDPLTSME